MKITFNHEFLDWLALSENHVYLKDLRKELGLDRNALAKAIGISSSTIRKYESNWSGSGSPPAWYEMLLRLLCGDLSHFGQAWHNCRIHRHDNKLSSPYFNMRMTPMDMNGQYARWARQYESQIKELNRELAETQKKNALLMADYKLLLTKIEAYENEIAMQEAHEKAIESGKVVNIGRHRRSKVGS